jgi:arylsulfate sulfotransferase
MKTYPLFGLTVLVASWMPLAAQPSVSLRHSIPSPARPGTPVRWTAAVSGAEGATLVYRFRVRRAGEDFRTVVDFGPKSTLDWSPIDGEGLYEVELTVKDHTGRAAQTSAMFVLTPLVAGETPGIVPSAHPLVFVYSAPPCAAESRLRVQFYSADGYVQRTPSRPCDPAHGMNFYLAGLRPETQYEIHHTIQTGIISVDGPVLTLTTPSVALQPPGMSTVIPPVAPDENGILLQSVVNGTSIATDLNGNLVWFAPDDITLLTRPEAGGTFLGIGEEGTQDISHQFVREFDLAGLTLAETNAARVNEQLAQMGMHPITSFHHEARKLPGGNYLVLAGTERLLTDVQGPGTVDVLGDMILVLDPNLQVIWAWDAFDHLDARRQATLGETCTFPAGLSCATFYLSATVNDWLHGNALQLTPDGNILYSARHQDWVIKIDYQNGTGSGDVIWRLGQDGDFQINASDPNPWFSHQHDPNFLSDNSTLLLFDNGNTRQASDATAHSRGQVLQIDELNRAATLALNADMGAYSSALGSAQRLRNGNFHFGAGFIIDESSGSRVSQSVVINTAGDVVRNIQFLDTAYRTFQMRDLYTAP